MNIVYICREFPPALRLGGIGSYVYEMASNLVKHKHKVTVICASDDTNIYREYIYDGINVIRLSKGDFIVRDVEYAYFYRKFRALYRFYSYRRSILSALNRIKDVDVIEVAEFGAEAYYLASINIPVIIRLHTPTLLDRNNFGILKLRLNNFVEYWVGKQEVRTLLHFKYITSCSHSLVDWFKEYLPKLKVNPKVIYNPLDIARWNLQNHSSYEENLILYVGTVAETKGIGDLIRACELLRENGTSVKLRIAGKMGSYACHLKKYVESKRLDWCVFLGNVPREQLKQEYMTAKVSCFPSWWENMPLVCLEAMLSGNIVVGSSSGGMSEIITDGKDGYLVIPHDIKALSNCLHKALDLDNDAVERMKCNARRKIRNKFSISTVMKEMEDYYTYVVRDFNKNGKNIVG